MPKESMVFELTDEEIRAFWFSVPSFRKFIHNSKEVSFDRIPLPTGIIEQGTVRDEKTLINILLSYRLQHPGNFPKAYLAVSLQLGFIDLYTIPWLSKYERKSAIDLLVDEEISIARSDLLFDFCVISEEKPNNLQVILGATRRSILEQYANIFGQAGFRVIGADFAHSVLGQALGFQASMDALYLREESGSLHMVLFRGAVPQNERSLPFILSNEESEGGKKGWINDWKNEIGRFLLYCRTQHSDLELKRLVWSGGCNTELLALELGAANHNLMVEQATLKNIPHSWQKLLEENRGFGEVALGYGRRILVNRPGLNLWLRPVVKEKVKKTYLGLAFLASLILITGTLMWFSLREMALPLEQDVAQLASHGSRIEEQNGQQEALQAAWNRVSIHSEMLGERLAQVLALSSAKVKIEQIDFKQGSLSVRGSAKDSKSVQEMIQALRVLGWEAPSLTGYKLTVQSIVEFTLSAKQDSTLSQDSDQVE